MRMNFYKYNSRVFVLYDHVGISESTITHTLFLVKPVIFDGHNTTSDIINEWVGYIDTSLQGWFQCVTTAIPLSSPNKFSQFTCPRSTNLKTFFVIFLTRRKCFHNKCMTMKYKS
jgi:hypothetical protein